MIKNSIINPMIIFLFSWISVFTLYYIRLSNSLNYLTAEFINFCIALAVFCILSFYIGAKSARCHRIRYDTKSIKSIYIFLIILFVIIIAVFSFTLVYFGGFPLAWAIIGNGKSYTEFGIPTIHGFFNSTMLFLSACTLWMFIKKIKYRFIIVILLFCVAVPILSLHRQSLVSMLLQFFFIYAAINRENAIRSLRNISLFIVVITVVFSVLGNVRTGEETIRQQANLSYLGDLLPSYAVWAYMYLVSPLSNFYELTTIRFEFSMGQTGLSGLTPTFIRNIIWGETSEIFRSFVDRTFNAYTYAFPLYMDFGWYGVFIFSAFILFFCGAAYKRFILMPSLYNLLFLAFLNHVVLLFVFANFFLTWGILFEFVLLRICKSKLQRIAA